MMYKTISQNTLQQLKLVNSYLRLNTDFKTIKESLNLKFETLKDYTTYLLSISPFEVAVFTDNFTFEQTLSFIENYAVFNSNFKNKIKKIITYPIVLFVSIYLLMYFFNFFLIPTLLATLSLLKLNLDFFKLLAFILTVVFYGLSLILLGALLSVLSISTKKGLKRAILKSCRFRYFRLFKMIITYQFALIFDMFYQYGFSTKEIIFFLRQNRKNYLIQWIATLIDYELDEGTTFSMSIKNPILDETFINLVHLATLDGRLHQSLLLYLDNSALQIELILQKHSNFIKSLLYILLGILIILMYFILLAPISMMSQL